MVDLMVGHIMPSFPHSLIGLGPFSNQGCTIVFTKTTVTVYDASSCTILAGWQECTGARLWHFLIGAPATATGIPTLLPTPVPRPSPTSVPDPASNLPVALAAHPHPSKGIIASDKVGDRVTITYLYRCTEQVALTTRASHTPFDPRSLDLPSISALVSFYHACLSFPVKQTWLDAIKAGKCDTVDGLIYSNVAQYCPNADETILGHLAIQRQNVKSTKKASPLHSTFHPPVAITPSNEVFIQVYPLSKLYTNDTGRFPVQACTGNQYIMIAYHADGNLILQEAFQTWSDRHRIAAYNFITTCLAARGLLVDLQIWTMKPVQRRSKPSPSPGKLNFSWYLRTCIGATGQSAPSAHSRPYLWDLLLPPAELSLNLLRQATLNGVFLVSL
jgi:hypothetical protein